LDLQRGSILRALSEFWRPQAEQNSGTKPLPPHSKIFFQKFLDKDFLKENL
jgi:hypothetical protein